MATRKEWNEARINPQGNALALGVDKRVKLTESDKAEIIKLHARGNYSQREIARAFGVSRRLIVFTLYPERLEHARELYKERRKDGRYYIKKKHTEAQRKHRAHLRELNPELSEGDKRGDTIRRLNAERERSRKAKMDNGQEGENPGKC